MLYSHLCELRAQGKTLRDIAGIDLSGRVSYGTVGRMLQGREPKDPAIRKALGLALFLPAPVCQICGKVHVTRTCPDQRKQHTRWADWPISRVLVAILLREEF